MGRHLAVGCLAQQASRPSRGPRAPPPPLGDGGPGERDRHREADRVDCVRIVHLSETCEDDPVNLIRHAMTTVATVHEARCTAAVHEALAGRGLVPATHPVDAAYVDAEFLARSREDHGIELVGPPRPSPAWRGKARSRAATRPTGSRATGPGSGRAARQGSCSRPGSRTSPGGEGYVLISFAEADCGPCPARPLCTRARRQPRLRLHPRAEHEALTAARERLAT